MKVIVGMSGGVDSSIAAYLLKETGCEVQGVSFILEEQRIKSETLCCSAESLQDARKAAERFGIPHDIVNLRSEFAEEVIGPFIAAYEAGLTPNPCILCNERIKFRYLLKIANERKAEFIATGHYARVISGRLLKAVDEKKDQSYVLYVLDRSTLGRLKLPLGERRKSEVREIARALELPSANRPESQEICFVGGDSYSSFVGNVTAPSEGPIIDALTGGVIGAHHGIHAFTVGQRKRLGIATEKPLFVVRIDPLNKAVYVGPREMAMVREFVVKEVNWLVPPRTLQQRAPSLLPQLGKGGIEGFNGFRATVKVRSTMKDEPASVVVINDTTVRVVYDEPQWAPAPGQSAVFYDGDVVLGGGVIERQE